MGTRLASVALCCLLSIAGAMLIGCTPNEAYRTALPANCAKPDCGDAPDTFIEKHDGYDLAYVEFTERGNVFDRARMKQVVDHVAAQARYDPSNPDRGVFTIVFVHGWKHNARADDGNVDSFRKLLRQVHDIAKQNPIGTPRKVDRRLRWLARTVGRLEPAYPSHLLGAKSDGRTGRQGRRHGVAAAARTGSHR